jgi:ubiquinone/menaquinone biosynthesis C-methylase UbiE
MNHNDHVNLLKPANLPQGGAWADFGAGAGAFTLALRELVGPSAEIYAVDKDRSRLNDLEREYRNRFGEPKNLHSITGDFTKPLDLPALNGVVMANSLHFFKEKKKVLEHVRTFLKPEGLLLLVEYNVDSGNPWVPYPLTFETWCALALRTGFNEPRLLTKRPSSFLREFYSAMTQKAGD